MFFRLEETIYKYLAEIKGKASAAAEALPLMKINIYMS